MSKACPPTIALFGAGKNIGIPIVKAFVDINSPILVIARPTSDLSALPKSNLVTVARVDTTSVSSVAGILRDNRIDVLISGVSYIKGGVDAQVAVARASRNAGVKLFLPSEFGIPTGGGTDPMPKAKSDFAEYLKSIGLPSLRIYCGQFHHSIPWLSAVDETGTFYIVGKGTTPQSYTAVSDVAGYVAHVLTTQTLSNLFDIELRIEGQRATLVELGALYSGTATVEHVQALPRKDMYYSEVREYLQNNGDRGIGSSGWDWASGTDDENRASSGNAFWSGHRWLTAKEVLRL
ncbi:hypothetical protein HYDPIDRAFT_114134 [Hydnomerulius pinastri MD-312]|uniref:NmrA-like domain-containing protein n=1 Tax=Hydnomerulius pinastri MD-312 TaxID=994086 RepID=A0A0C9VXK9_9AGAM|nr:hypothetical protein HYDPIDRAFT_114134 [Hydnomerulius pinastri MD-312]